MGVENEDSSREHSLSRYSMQKIQSLLYLLYAVDTVYSVIYYCSIYYCSSRYCSIYYSIYCSRYSLQKRMLTYSRKGKYHCKADLLFDWFAFDQTSKSVVHTTQAKQLKANKSNQMSVVQRHLHL